VAEEPKLNDASGFDPAQPRPYLKTVRPGPGVYQMLDAQGGVLYVGKARNLRKRLASYFRDAGIPSKTLAMMRRVAGIEVLHTHTETEAFLLESNLIKKLRPRYNIELKDDKSYPYIRLETDHPYPRLGFYRGNRAEPGRYFGPFANAGAVRETLAQLQKVFLVRQCEDSVFRNRSRPCLQYQIRRCTGPCVNLISADRYAEDVRQAGLFLEGRNQVLFDELVARMNAAAARTDYEEAARLRDRIAALRRTVEQQNIVMSGPDADVVVLLAEQGTVCAEVEFIRGGRHCGGKAFFPGLPIEATPGEWVSDFLAQFYLDKPVPPEVIVQPAPEHTALVEELLSVRSGRQVDVRCRVRGHRARWLDMAVQNCHERLQRRIAESSGYELRRRALAAALDMPGPPARIECFDVSHAQGEATVASCVVFDEHGPAKSSYRRYNIAGVTPGDDYAAMEQALSRRYRRLKDSGAPPPDLLLIDGGAGQLARARAVLAALGMDGLTVAAVAKGPARKPGTERLFLRSGSRPASLAADAPALHLIQQVRDEAHRFAIAGHRMRRDRRRRSSRLQEIPGIGAKRRQALLSQLGGLQEVERAGVADLGRVPGISRELARRIYNYLHPTG
jgi:excinuclease ABC subunit C